MVACAAGERLRLLGSARDGGRGDRVAAAGRQGGVRAAGRACGAHTRSGVRAAGPAPAGSRRRPPRGPLLATECRCRRRRGCTGCVQIGAGRRWMRRKMCHHVCRRVSASVEGCTAAAYVE